MGRGGVGQGQQQFDQRQRSSGSSAWSEAVHLVPLRAWALVLLAMQTLFGFAAAPAHADGTEATTGGAASPPRTTAEILAASPAEDWRALDPENTLYLDLERPGQPSGRVVIELAPGFAPRHVAAIKAMVRAGAESPAVTRVQDNFVTQWRLTAASAPALTAEFTRPAGADLRFTPLPDRDAYAPEVGFVEGFPAARDAQNGAAWLVHCYGMVAVGRENEADSGNGAELYTVIGQAPRQLDRNMTVVGRIVAGAELLSSLPRGNGAMGFYEAPQQEISFRSVRLAADVPAGDRVPLEVMKTGSASFAALVEARRNRRDAFYHVPANAIDVCNVPLPVRERATATAQAR